MYSRIHLIAFIGFLLWFFMVPGVLASGQGYSGIDGMDQGSGSGFSDGYDTGSHGSREPESPSFTATTISDVIERNGSDQGSVRSVDPAGEGNSVVVAAGEPDPPEAIAPTRTGEWYDSGEAGFSEVLSSDPGSGYSPDTSSGIRDVEHVDRRSGPSLDTKKDGSINEVPLTQGVEVAPQVPADGSSGKNGKGLEGSLPPSGIFSENNGISPDKGSQGGSRNPESGGGIGGSPNDVIDASIQKQHNTGIDQGFAMGVAAGGYTDESPKSRSQHSGAGYENSRTIVNGIFSGSSPDLIVMGTVGGVFMSRETGSGAASENGNGNRGQETAVPPRSGNPWGDSTNRQIPPAETEPVPELSKPAARFKGKREEESSPYPNPDPGVHGDDQETRPPDIPFLLFSFLGYRRIQKANVLQNPGRQRIFQLIIDKPGIDVASVSDAAGMNINTARYHLAKLIGIGKVTYLARPGILRYYSNQGRFSEFEQVIIHYIWNSSTAGILALIFMRPGVSRQDIADNLNISGPSVTRHMHHLIEDQIVINEPEGMTNHYRLSQQATAVMKDLRYRISLESGVFSYAGFEPGISYEENREIAGS
jgi:predicted transcriptional regulator